MLARSCEVVSDQGMAPLNAVSTSARLALVIEPTKSIES